MAQKARLAYGALEGVDAAIESGALDSYDVLFLRNAEGKAFVGWIDKNGNKVIVENENENNLVRVSELPIENGDVNVIYIYNNEGYIWDDTTKKCISLAKSADLAQLETEIADKVNEATVDTKVEMAVDDAKGYTDEKITEINDKIGNLSSIEIIEF